MNAVPETVHWLCTLKNHGSKFGIDRMALFDAALGTPSQAFPAIHVAGSNGKGSTCAMLESIFRKRGLTTGLYTSPHLVRLGERIQINRKPLADSEICAYVAKLRPTANALAAADPDDSPSFFEFMTAMAFLEFQRRAVQIALVETGLGGRLDATNILTPRVSVITSISLEHTEYLGETLAKVAAEKAGIIKKGVPVAFGAIPPEAENALRTIALERGAPAFSVREIFKKADLAKPTTNLAGDHQRANAALALLATSLFDCVAAANETPRQQNAIPETALLERLRANSKRDSNALLEVDWAARWQNFPLSHGRQLILDAAHNAECAMVLEPLLADLVRHTGRKPIIVTGALGLARARPLLALFSRYASALYLVRPEQERSCSFEELESCIPANFAGNVTRASIDTLFPTLGECALGTAGETVLAAGSVYLAGEILARLRPSPNTPLAFQDKLPSTPRPAPKMNTP